MSTRKKSQYECKKKVTCLDCGAVVASEHRKKHSDRKHPGKINFKFYIDPKQPTLQFARKDNNSNIDGSVQGNTVDHSEGSHLGLSKEGVGKDGDHGEGDHHVLGHKEVGKCHQEEESEIDRLDQEKIVMTGDHGEGQEDVGKDHGEGDHHVLGHEEVGKCHQEEESEIDRVCQENEGMTGDHGEGGHLGLGLGDVGTCHQENESDIDSVNDDLDMSVNCLRSVGSTPPASLPSMSPLKSPLKLSSVLKRKRRLSDGGGPSNSLSDAEAEDMDDRDAGEDDEDVVEPFEAVGGGPEYLFSQIDDDDGPKKPMLQVYHPKTYGKQKRDFQPSWLKHNVWLGYDTNTHSGYCYPCIKFMKSNFHFNNWKKSERLSAHAATDIHTTAMIKWVNAKEAIKNNNSITTQLNSFHTEKVKENRKYLQILIETIAMMGKQNLSFRAHTEDRTNLTQLSNTNRGNFLEILYLQSRHSPFLRERLEILRENKSHGPWTSSHIQNELIDLLASFTRKKIVEEINNKNSGDVVIGIISDETSDISRHEQISLVISYINANGEKRESFLGFIKTDKCDGETLFRLITEEIKRLGLSLDTVVGLGFDGAGNMAGINKVNNLTFIFKLCKMESVLSLPIV